MNRFVAAALLTGALALGTTSVAAQTTVYSNDFETSVNATGGTWSVNNGALVQKGAVTGAPSKSLGVSRPGPSGTDDTFWNHTASLTLSSLAPYTSGRIFFSVFVWGTWDPYCCSYGPDLFRFNINGGSDLITDDLSGHFSWAGYAGKRDFEVAFTSAAGTTPTFNFITAATQDDEGLTIDDVRVEVNHLPTVTPEPVSMALLGTGLAGIGAVRRRRRKQA